MIKWENKNCEKCGKLNDRGGKCRVCSECLMKNLFKNRKKRNLEKSKILGEFRKANPMRCLICGEIISGRVSRKYCPACYMGRTKEQVKQYSLRCQEAWANLTETERLRRMALISKKLLEEQK